MADAIVSAVLQQLLTIIDREVEQEVRRVVGVEQEVEQMKNTFRTIQAVLVDAESKQLKDEAVKVWLDKLKHISYDIDDVLDQWKTAILRSRIERDQAQSSSASFLPGKVCSFIPSPCSCFGGVALCHDIAFKIEELNAKLQAIAREKDGFSFVVGLTGNIDLNIERPKTTSLIDESEIYGRDDEKDELIRLLLRDNNGGGSGKGIPLIAIVGMGGLGKTTLAQLAYNNDEVKDHFPLRIWVCVSDPFDEFRVAKSILEALGARSQSKELENLLQEIRQNIKGKKFLLVLDDVWTEDEKSWKPLKLSLSSGSQESKILVTTRKEKAANILGCAGAMISLGVLSNEDACWSLFSKIAFFGRSNGDCQKLESIGRKFVEKCAGLPLAIKTLASLLRFKRTKEQWQRILDSEMWKLEEEILKNLYAPLLLSYYDLPMSLKQCFRYCAIFPKDHWIKRDELIKLWMAQGFLGEAREGNGLEIFGEECFDSLAIRGFFQEFEKDEIDGSIIQCKMHDIVHDFAQILTKTECLLLASDGVQVQTRVESSHENVRHLTLSRLHSDDHVPILDPMKKLRSLLIMPSVGINDASTLSKLFHQLISLRMLRLRCRPEFPKEIGKLIHLRYLGLEGNNELNKLPEALCDLCNLQTLNIRWCGKLRELPRGMEKLINLRHLQNGGTPELLMSKGMQRLTCLQTLEEFEVVKKGGGIESETSFSLADLGKLIHLQGELFIGKLGNVGEVSEAREARISTKAGLRTLALNFRGDGQTRIEDEAFVLEALHPPQHLQSLRIGFCKGPEFPFPSWMTSLTSLKSVTLFNCDNWESLPPMGKLPSLESLIILRMTKLQKVGEEFVGVETSSINHNIAFPNLKRLTFQGMNGWEEWEYETVLRSSGGDDSSSSNITIMPKLQRLSISDCPGLKKLPCYLLQSTALQQLDIERSLVLFGRFNKETGDDWPSISHIPTVQIKA